MHWKVLLIFFEVEFVVNDIKEIVWNSSSFENLTILIAKKKIITTLVKTHIFRAFNDTFNNFIEKKRQGLITLLQYVAQRWIVYHSLTYTSNDFFEVDKILTAEELFKYLEKSLYAVCHALLRSSDHSDILDICWRAESEDKAAWNLIISCLSSCSSLKDNCSSWQS